ncbi:hypothetical protein ACWEGQ_03665 [Streptomyces seoulensis]
MTSGHDDSPATLYGPVSSVLGVAGLVAAVFSGAVGIPIPVLAASFAIIFALLGLRRGTNRVQCVTGLVAGCFWLARSVFLVAFLSR